MKKFLALALAFSFLFVGFPGKVKAQAAPVFLTTAATVNADTDYGNTYFYLLLTGNVTTFGFTATAPQNGMTVTVVFVQDATGSRTVGWATNVGSQTVTSTASVATMIRFTYDVQTQHWYTTKLTT